MTERHDAFREAAEIALGSMLDFIVSDEGQQKRKEMGAGAFVREYCSIKLNLGRANGKTTFIVDKAARSDIIITLNHAHVQELARRFKEAELPVPYIDSLESLSASYLGKRDLDKRGETIWVDNASYMDQNELASQLQKIAVHVKPEHIVYLG